MPSLPLVINIIVHFQSLNDLYCIVHCNTVSFLIRPDYNSSGSLASDGDAGSPRRSIHPMDITTRQALPHRRGGGPRCPGQATTHGRGPPAVVEGKQGASIRWLYTPDPPNRGFADAWRAMRPICGAFARATAARDFGGDGLTRTRARSSAREAPRPSRSQRTAHPGCRTSSRRSARSPPGWPGANRRRRSWATPCRWPPPPR